VYKLPTPTSVVTNRVLKRQYFQQRSYSSEQTMTCTFNTGTDYVDVKNSALILKITATTSGVGDLIGNWGTGSASNIIRNIRVNHRSGTSYTNTQKINTWRKSRDRYHHNPQWFATVGALMGYDGALDFNDTVTDGETITCVIPLTHVHPFFDPEGGVMLPANMASGLRVELDLESAVTAFLSTDGANPLDGYTIDDCYFQTMNISLMDSAGASLNSVAQKSSLEYIYKDVFTSQNSHPSNQNQINIDIAKSVAFADTAFSVIQAQSDLSLSTADSFSSAFIAGKWDMTLGSNHYPNVKVDSKPLAYHNALITYDKLKKVDMPSFVTPALFAVTDAIYAVSLERDTALALSQSPINASRALRFEMTFDTAPVVAQLVTVYLTYITSARTTLLNSRVDI